jgi:hypothetical protein
MKESRKTRKPQIKVRDLKAKKDVKGQSSSVRFNPKEFKLDDKP